MCAKASRSLLCFVAGKFRCRPSPPAKISITRPLWTICFHSKNRPRPTKRKIPASRAQSRSPSVCDVALSGCRAKPAPPSARTAARRCGTCRAPSSCRANPRRPAKANRADGRLLPVIRAKAPTRRRIPNPKAKPLEFDAPHFDAAKSRTTDDS